MKQFLLFLILFPYILKAQTSFKVQGQIKDIDGNVIPFATIGVSQLPDSTTIKGDFSDENGNFYISLTKEGEFFLKISSVGFEDFLTPKFILNQNNSKINLAEIILKNQSNELENVVVTAKKPFIEQQIDKTILNVENSIVATGNSALEILEKAPSVRIDHQNERILFKNKTGILFLIDGKKSYLSDTDLIRFLSSLTSDQIASIELISNPSAKYDASGNSGIINIKLKKNQGYGTNGSVSSTVAKGFIPNAPKNLWRGDLGLNINFRREKFNLFGNANLYRTASYNDNTIQRNVNYEDTKSYFDQLSRRTNFGLARNFKLGFDYFLNKKTTLGILIDSNNWDGDINAKNATKINETIGDEITKSSLAQTSGINIKQKNFNSNFNFKHEFNEKGQELTFDVDYSLFNQSNEQNFNTDFFDEKGSLFQNLKQRSNLPNHIDISAVKLAYTHPFNEKTKMDVGFKTGLVNTDNNFKFEKYQDNFWVNDSSKSNYFKYKELIVAGYFNINKEWEKFGVQGGLRVENTKSNGESITLNTQTKRNYTNFFPSIFLNQKINKNNAIRYSYSRRIDRPNYQNLNPFIFYLDPYTYSEGNPYLKPQYTNNFELNYSYKSEYNLTFGYTRTTDLMQSILEQNDSTSITKEIPRNLKLFQNYNLNITFPISIAKWWLMQNNVSFYYNLYQDPNFQNAVLDAGRFAYNFNISNSITLKKDWSAEVSMWFNSPNLEGIFNVIKPQYAINAGIQKSILKKKGKLKANISDIFFTTPGNAKVNYQNMDLFVQSRWLSRRASISFTYNFGNEKVKSARKRSTAIEEERNRAGG